MPLNLSAKIHLNPTYSFHVTDGLRAHLFSETNSYVLHGRAFPVVLPLISSQPADIMQLIEKTIESISPELIIHSINLLVKEGIAFTQPQDKNQDNLYWLLSDSGKQASQATTPKQSSVSIFNCGLPDTHASMLKKTLKSMGIISKSSDQADITLLLTNDYLNKDLEKEIKSLNLANKNWLLIKPVGIDIWVGPLSTDNNVCWDCAVTRLLDNRLGQHVFAEDLRDATIPPLISLKPQSNTALNLIASFLAHHLRSNDQQDLSENIIVLNTAALSISRHFLLADPACSCAHSTPQNNIYCTQSEELYTHHEHNYRAASSAETYARISKLVSPITGLIPELCRSDQYDSSYIYYARHGFSISQELSSNRISGRPSWACGKGTTDVDARVSCVAEAIERYSAGYFGNEKVITARFTEQPDAVNPNDVLLFSDDQYKNRDSINTSYNEFHWVPERFDPEEVIEWVKFTSLGKTDDIYLPARFSYLNYNEGEGKVFCKADSNGCASGNSIDEAVLFGVFELIERDSVSIWWFNELLPPLVDVTTFNDYSIECITRSLHTENRKLIVIDITTDVGIHTFAAISWLNETKDQIYIGYGTHLDPLVAIKRSLNEVMQIASYNKENPLASNPVIKKWLHGTSLHDLPFLTGNEQSIKTNQDYLNLSSGSISGDINQCITMLANCELNLYALNLTRGDDFLPTVRVVVPGLRHFWPRLAPGRLYDSSARTMLSSEVKLEDELNKHHYPL